MINDILFSLINLEKNFCQQQVENITGLDEFSYLLLSCLMQEFTKILNNQEYILLLSFYVIERKE